MFGASQVLRVNEHVRVDIFYARLSSQKRSTSTSSASSSFSCR